MSSSFTIARRTDGSYKRDANNRVLVTGTDAGELAWLDHTQLDSIAKAKAARAVEAEVAKTIDAQLESDPVVQAMKAGKEKLEEVSKVSQVPTEFVSETIVKAEAGAAGTNGHAVVFNHDSQVIRLIEAGNFDNLVWDTTQVGSAKIAVLF